MPLVFERPPEDHTEPVDHTEPGGAPDKGTDRPSTSGATDDEQSEPADK